MDNQSGGDLLSDLPLQIILTILAFVPIRDAIRTSILSRQWRYIWASLHRLVFDDVCVSCSEEDEIYQGSLKRFITTALFLHRGPIYEFKLFVSHLHSDSDTNNWLLSLSRNDIRVLNIATEVSDDGEWFQLPSSLYSCHKLTGLQLFGCELCHPPPTLEEFSWLRFLEFQDVNVVAPTTFQSLVALCPRLESLTLEQCGIPELRFSAPNLRDLSLIGDYEEICLYAPLLAQLYIEIDMREDGFKAEELRQQKSPACKYTKILGSFTNVESFAGKYKFTQYLSIDMEVDLQDINEIYVVVRLVMGAPNLHGLNIIACNYEHAIDYDPPISPRISFLDFGCPPDFKFDKLRVIEMRVGGMPLEIELIKFLLISSSVLEKLSLVLRPESEAVPIFTAAELLRYERASPNAAIVCKSR